jgi:predicted metal-binding membrane protein
MTMVARSLRHAGPWIAPLALTVTAWIVTLRQAAGMGGMFDVRGVPMPLFLGMWIVMMAAMMFPSVAPTAILWSTFIRRSSTGAERARRMGAFLAGYLLAWGVYGVLAFAALYGLAAAEQRAPDNVRWIGAALLLFAGVYQLTPLKRVCLRHCRSPHTFLLQYLAFPGGIRDLRVGIHHGLYCVGCCWGLMIVLIAAGIMNIAAMVALAFVISLEKLWRRGELVATVLGLAFLGASVVAAFSPSLLPGLQASGDAMPMRM